MNEKDEDYYFRLLYAIICLFNLISEKFKELAVVSNKFENKAKKKKLYGMYETS